VKIKRLIIENLQNRQGQFDVTFDSELNILTGRNGAGKTGILKILWYTISGNLGIALKEVPFSQFSIETDRYTIRVKRTGTLTCSVILDIDGRSDKYDDWTDDEGNVYENAEDLAAQQYKSFGSSLFFPTFRRMEGGFSTADRTTRSSNHLAAVARSRAEVEDALQALSSRLTEGEHRFITSLSTRDVTTLLLNEYTKLSEIAVAYQDETTQSILLSIKEFQSGAGAGDTKDKAVAIIDRVRKKIEDMEQEKVNIFAPIAAIQKLASTIFIHSGIQIGKKLTFGESVGAVSSDALSAGEKQMLSFICYNAFFDDTIFFIDEPELSLHVDWQRQFFSILSSQGKKNQFIVATHSPFIYTKYPDKEIILNSNRGNSEEN